MTKGDAILAEAMKKAGPLIPAFLGLARGAKAPYNAAAAPIWTAAAGGTAAEAAGSKALG